jgi:hypothetical protein
MNKFLQAIFLFCIVLIVSCDEPPIPKPEQLVSEKKMIDMLVDIHLAEAMFGQLRYDSDYSKLTSADYYYSVLEKHNMPDSIFEKSLVYYASEPRDFEKMYQKVLDKLNIMEQELSGRKQDLLELEEEQQ